MLLEPLFGPCRIYRSRESIYLLQLRLLCLLIFRCLRGLSVELLGCELYQVSAIAGRSQYMLAVL